MTRPLFDSVACAVDKTGLSIYCSVMTLRVDV